MFLSVVIPVYNSERTIAPLTERLQRWLSELAFEIILVNDGSADRSELVCQQLENRYDNVTALSLRRNFGEFNAVLCGLNHTVGQYVAIIDDDFQNPPEAILALVEAAESGQYDVVYSRYARKQHHWFRNVGSRIVNTLTTYSIGKPRDLYLSSFKVIRREVVDEICRYKGPYPYIDGLIFRITSTVGSVEVAHNARVEGRSNYTARKLISLFMNVFIGYSLWPIRMFTVLGAALMSLGLLGGLVLIMGWLTNKVELAGWIIVTWAILTGLGIQLLFLGVLGEYLGKLFMAHSGLPPYVIKHGSPRKEQVVQQ
ncbi:glycosyltransferase family 2 protein [Spirosoma fluviale]|uniref:Undecaprenyl-phosphate 4-deoxy-4-formamido-L-arabinose transferase n=1 Tax=Spirosoma fluviale TaxID=1597977 RepID=A0A286F4F8_9BACT|nr:glycosyltransferase family 2 protein [Spirosoma fluviale]SOD78053.1 undecaprenyl-phosphate 4-deoxy-4-formamido-L-arabinose transferase [Spirosoma fluviale]